MGFWHTGYIEFHEPVGFDEEWNRSPVRVSVRVRCVYCDLEFTSDDELRKHRFAAHPLRRPTLYLDGRELGTQRVRVTRKLVPETISVCDAERAVLNGRDVEPAHLGSEIAKVSRDVCRIVLSKDGVDAHFELEVRVASNEDLLGVETQFGKMAARRRLDARAIEDFISGASNFTSAIGYCDGICSYLYGLLAKERAADCSLSHEAYVAKYSQAVDTLASYHRKLANTIIGLIEFHFNHFGLAKDRCPDSRLGDISSRYEVWTTSRNKDVWPDPDGEERKVTALERLVTEWDTECILKWACLPAKVLFDQIHDIEVYLERDLAEFDRVKIHMLLGEIFAAVGRPSLALEHAQAVRNLPTVERWAESLIRQIGESK